MKLDKLLSRADDPNDADVQPEELVIRWDEKGVALGAHLYAKIRQPMDPDDPTGNRPWILEGPIPISVAGGMRELKKILSTAATGLQRRIDELQKDLELKKTELGAVSEAHAELENRIGTLRADNAELLRRIEELTQALAETNKKLETLSTDTTKKGE